MNKRFRIHIILIILMYSIFLMFALFYKRDISNDVVNVICYYFILVTILFILNLIKRRLFKWLTFLLVFILPLSFLIFTGTTLDYNSLNVLISAAPVDVPFLPSNLAFEINNHLTDTIITFFLYFLLPLFYWYGLYSLSKKLDILIFDKTR